MTLLNNAGLLQEHHQIIDDDNAGLNYNSSLGEWVKIKTFVDMYPQFEISQLRWLLLHRDTNGLKAHVRKIGKHLYISVSGFLYWLENNCGS